jgi:hypothetical protein
MTPAIREVERRGKKKSARSCGAIGVVFDQRRRLPITTFNDFSFAFEADGTQKKSVRSVRFTLYGPDITLFRADLLYSRTGVRGHFRPLIYYGGRNSKGVSAGLSRV